MCVADHGLGLKQALGGVYPVRSDRDAIRLALEMGRSSKSNAHNPGQGLNLLDDALKNNGGSLLLASGSSYHVGMRNHVQVRDLPSQLPGTLVLMKFRIDNDLYGLDHPQPDLW